MPSSLILPRSIYLSFPVTSVMSSNRSRYVLYEKLKLRLFNCSTLWHSSNVYIPALLSNSPFSPNHWCIGNTERCPFLMPLPNKLSIRSSDWWSVRRLQLAVAPTRFTLTQAPGWMVYTYFRHCNPSFCPRLLLFSQFPWKRSIYDITFNISCRSGECQYQNFSSPTLNVYFSQWYFCFTSKSLRRDMALPNFW